MSIAEKLVEVASAGLARRSSRRGFLMRSAVVGSALAVNPFKFALKPGTAYASLCGPDSHRVVRSPSTINFPCASLIFA